MRSVVQQLNWGLLMSRRFHGGPPPYLYRKAWRRLLTVYTNLQGTLSDNLESKLKEALEEILDVDGKISFEAVSSLQDLADTIAAQSGNQIPQAEANAMTGALQQMIQLARYQTA